MLRITGFLWLMLVFAVIVQCSEKASEPPDEPLRPLTAAEQQITESAGKFGLKVFREVIQSEPGKNVFISPLSISMALGMAYNGAEGTTEDAMQTTLELAGLTEQEINEAYRSLIDLLTELDPDVIFEIANSIWHRPEFPAKQGFIDVNRTYFDAEVTALDFGRPDAADIMNGWVDEKTHGKISEVIQPPINALTMMFLINAVYFKGTWTTQFDPKNTHDDRFELEDGSTAMCDMMMLEHEFSYFENDVFQAIILPYGNQEFSMTVFLPRPSVSTDSLISLFTEENWNSWLGSFGTATGELHLPKFRLEYNISLNAVLSALGMGVAFDPSEADFTGIAERSDLHISQVVHKTFVEVDEEGTVAAAVTVVEIGITSVTPPLMYVNRPFVFVIRDRHSQSILFIGRVLDPTGG